MKLALFTACALGLGSVLATLPACSTDRPGTNYVMGAYTGNVDAAPDKTTTAARKAAEDLKLRDIVANGTKVDGKVTARTAQNENVTISIEQAGENVSRVSIRVGAVGDESLSRQLFEKTQSHLRWF